MIGNREEDEEEEALDSQRHEEEEAAAEEEDAGGNTTAICNETQDPNLPSCCSNHTKKNSPKKIHQKNSQMFGMILCIKASNGLPNSDVKPGT
jgi:hypothetical protein